MSSPFCAQNFFFLKKTAHKDLWSETEPVWEALARLDAYLRLPVHEKTAMNRFSDVYFQKPESVFIGEGTIIEPGALICGPCVIGRGCVIRQGAYLRGGVLCADQVIVGHGCEVKHSILLEGACIAHFSYVGDSILGNRVNLGAGVKCSNLRLDRKEIAIQGNSARIETGLKKLGSIIGDGCQFGCNVVLNPGTVVGPECICFPLVQLRGVISAGQLIQNSQEIHLSPIRESSLLALKRLQGQSLKNRVTRGRNESV